MLDILALVRRSLARIRKLLREMLLQYISPVITSNEFNSIYPLIVILLGVLAALNGTSYENAVAVTLFIIVAIVISILIFTDHRALSLTLRWNLVFPNHYRDHLLQLSRRVGRSLLSRESLDFVTYKSGDLITVLAHSVPDFLMVSGCKQPNIVSFDIEYVPVLRSTIHIDNDTNVRLIPLSDFWTSGSPSKAHNARIPSSIRHEILSILNPNKMLALPLTWGAVGVLICDQKSHKKHEHGHDIFHLICADSNKPEFTFPLFFQNVESIKLLGYEIICLDWWTAIFQIVSLNLTGRSMSISQPELDSLMNNFREIRKCTPVENMISDTVAIMSRVRTSSRCIVIGGGTWFGAVGRLLPISVPDSTGVYGGFCECVGVVAPPEGITNGDLWSDDAERLLTWFVDNIGSTAPKRDTNAFRPYLFPALPRGRSVDYLEISPTFVEKEVPIIFRQFEAGSADGSLPKSARNALELWQRSAYEPKLDDPNLQPQSVNEII